MFIVRFTSSYFRIHVPTILSVSVGRRTWLRDPNPHHNNSNFITILTRHCHAEPLPIESSKVTVLPHINSGNRRLLKMAHKVRFLHSSAVKIKSEKKYFRSKIRRTISKIGKEVPVFEAKSTTWKDISSNMVKVFLKK